MGQSGFFDLDERYESLSWCGDPLEVLAKEITWESFRYLIKNDERFAQSRHGIGRSGRFFVDCGDNVNYSHAIILSMTTLAQRRAQGVSGAASIGRSPQAR